MREVGAGRKSTINFSNAMLRAAIRRDRIRKKGLRNFRIHEHVADRMDCADKMWLFGMIP